MKERRIATAVIAACSLLLFVPLARPLFTGRVFAYNDLAWFHLPMRYLYQEALRNGDTVLWTPSIFSGLYLQGEGQIGMFHPLHQLLYRLFPLQIAFNLELVANYPAAFAGMFWFLRRLHFGTTSALFGAMLFAFSGFNLLHHHHVNMVAVVAHLPWLLGAADVLIVDDRARARTFGFAAMALILASEFLLGFPQGVWWNAMALGAFALYRAGGTGRWRQLLPCAAAVILGVLLGGIQIWPTADVAAHSMRAGIARDFALSYSLQPMNLFQLWSPYFFKNGAVSEGDYMWFHEFGIYSGAVLPVALIWVWIRRGALRERRALMAAATVFAVFGLVLALGRYGWIAPLLTYLPVLESLRAPVRYILLSQFALAIVAAAAIDDLLAIADGTRAPATGWMPALWLPAALSVGTLLLLNTHVFHYGWYTFAGAAHAAPGVVFVVGVTVLVWLAGRRSRWTIAALAVLTMADLWVWGIRFISKEPPLRITWITQSIPRPDSVADSYAVAPGAGPFRADMLVMMGYRLTSGYVALYPTTTHQLESREWERLTGTRYRFSPEGFRFPVNGSVERMRLIDAEGHASTAGAKVAVDRPGHLVIHVDVPGPRTLAFTERFHEGWTATGDGKPLPTVAVDGDFLGCRVDRDVHRIELRFMPRSFVYGSMVSGVGALLLAGVLVARLR